MSGCWLVFAVDEKTEKSSLADTPTLSPCLLLVICDRVSQRREPEWYNATRRSRDSVVLPAIYSRTSESHGIVSAAV